MKEIVDILMRRDDMTREEAENCVEEFRTLLFEEINNGASLIEVEDLIADELGLEPDYLEYFLL